MTLSIAMSYLVIVVSMGYTRQSAALAVLIFEVLNKDKFSRKWTKQDYLIIALAIVFVLNIFKIFEHMIFFILQIQK